VTRSWLIVLNWNGRRDTLELLDSLARADLPDTTVLVVDNGSVDGTLQAVQELHPWVEMLQTGRNLGFAGGNNRGIDYARSKGADVIGVLNNDTVVDEKFWPPLVEVARRSRTAVSPDIRFADDPARSWFFGGVCSAAEGWPRHLQPHEQPPRSGLVPSEILTGCCMVADAQTWQDVGGFAEDYFLIFEDADWSKRAAALNVDLLVEPRSRIQHKVSRSFRGPQGGLGGFYYARNGTVFARRWLGRRAALRFAVRKVLADNARGVHRDGRRGLRALLVSAVGIFAAFGSRRGVAGHWVTRLAVPRPRSR
jgi:GT2 family glycosyltransferase